MLLALPQRARVSTKKLKKIALERKTRLRGRSRKGTRAVKKGVFVRGRRFSAEGLLTIDGMISNTVVEGSMTRDRFLHYLEFTVVQSSSSHIS